MNMIRQVNGKYCLVHDISVYGDWTSESVVFTSDKLSEIYHYIKLLEMNISIELDTKNK